MLIHTLDRDGITYALACTNGELDADNPPPHLDFLEVVSEFSYHLIDVDRRGVLAFLQGQLPQGIMEKVEKDPAWKSLTVFRKILVDPDHGGFYIE